MFIKQPPASRCVARASGGLLVPRGDVGNDGEMAWKVGQ